MTSLNADQQKDIVENAPENLKFNLLTGTQEEYNKYKENVKYTTPTTLSQAMMANNPYYNAMAVKNQKSIYAMDRAFRNIKSDSAINNFFGYWQKQVLNEERNSTILEAHDATGWKRDMLEDKIAQLETDINGLPVAEDTGDKLNETLSNIGRSVTKTMPYAIGGALLGASLPVSGLAAAGIAAAGRAVGGFATTYKPTQESLAVELLNKYPNLTKEQALEMAKTPAIMSASAEAVGDVFDLSTTAVSGLTKSALELSKKQLRDRIAEKIANKTLAKRFQNFVFKRALPSGIGEAGTEVLQNNFEDEGLKGKNATEIAKATVDNLLTLSNKLLTGQILTDKEKDDVETFVYTFLGDLAFGGVLQGINSSSRMIMDRNGQKSFETKTKKFNEAIKKSDMPNQMVDDIVKAEVKEGIAPQRVFANATEARNVLEQELNDNINLTDEQRTRVEQLIEQAKEAEETTGVFELDGEIYLNTVVNDKFSTTLFQKSQGIFFEKASMVKGDFTDTQLGLQAVQEMLPNAINKDSAFWDANNILEKNTGLSEQDRFANAMDFQVLMNLLEQVQGKTWQEIKKERGFKFNIEKGIFGQEKAKDIEVALDELKTNIKEGQSIAETGETVIVDEDNNVVDGNKQVEALKRKGEKKVKAKRVSNKQAQKFNDNQLSLFQNVAGSLEVSPKKIILSLTQSANPTTFAHESFHLFDVLMSESFAKGELNPSMLSMYKKMYKGAGVDIENNTGDLTDAREQLAEAWTQYLGEGKEPKDSFKGMFAKFKNMFAGMYQNFVRANALTKEIREAYDEIFFRQQEAEIVSKVMRLGGVEKPSNVSDEEYAKYVNALEKATAVASNKVISSMRRIKNEIKNSSEYLYVKQKAEERFRDNLQQETTYKVKEFNKEHAKDKLNYEALAIMYNNENGTNLTASEYEGMLKKPSLETEVNKLVSREMTRWLQNNYPELYKDMKTYNTIINNDMVDVLCYESAFATGKTFAQVKKQAEERVLDFVSKNKLRSIVDTEKYNDMMRNNLMLQENNGKDLGKLKFNQAVIAMIISKSKEYNKARTALYNKLNKYKTDPDKQEVKSLDAYTRDLLKSIGFDFGVHSRFARENETTANKLAYWIAEHDDLRIDRNLSDNLEFGFQVLEQADKMDNLTTSVFDDLSSLVKAIEDIGKQDTLGNKEEKQAELSADVQETVDYLKQIKFANKIKDKSFLSLITYSGMMMPRLLSKILPDRINFQYISPLVNGFSKATRWKNERAEEFRNILEKEMPRLKDIELVSLDNGETISLTREEKLMFLLNSVNEHNSGCMLLMIQKNPIRFGQVLDENDDKEGFARETYRKILESTDISLQETANAILEKIDSHKNEFKNATYRADGTILKLVKPNHFEFEGSILNKEMGYFPSPRKTDLKIDESFDTDFINRSGFPTAQFAKDRKAIHEDCEMSLDVINRWVRCVGDYINMAYEWKNLSSFLNKDSVLREALGETAFGKIKDWMAQLRQPEKTNYFLRQLDNISNIVILGFSPVKALRQLSGLSFTASEVGVGNTINAFFDYFSTNNVLNPLKTAMGLSDYMYNRYNDPSVYLFGGYSNYEVNVNMAKKVYGKFGKWALSLLTVVDSISSTITWKAQYNKSMLEGKNTKQASYDADRAVMLTQGESSALARPELLRGNLRYLSKYSTYFFGLNSALSSSLMTRGNPQTITYLTSVIFATMLFGSFYEALINTISDSFTGSDDDDDVLSKTMKEFMGTAGASVIPAWGLGGNLGKALAGDKVYRSSISSMSVADSVIRGFSYIGKGDFEEGLEKILTSFISNSIMK